MPMTSVLPTRAAASVALLISAVLLGGCAGLKKTPETGGGATTATPAPPLPVLPEPMTDQNSVQAFIEHMVSTQGFDRTQLTALFKQVKPRPRIVQIMTTPAESKPWNVYRRIFITDTRIQGGVAFWHKNEAALARAESQYGVPAAIIVAIIGVETRYGDNMGSFPVIDALSTLAFDYPPRTDYFRGELEQFLLLSREEQLDPLAPKGSYAGAMGEAQFMPSSYRKFSVDFDGDGKRDLWHSTSDAIGSIANYLNAHGWQRGEPIALRARIDGNGYQNLLDATLKKPERSIARFKVAGVMPEVSVDDTLPAMLVRLETDDDAEYWLGLDNFYAITRYNHSPRYAMAVYQLSQEIQAQRAAPATPPT